MAKGNAAAGLALDTARGWHHLRGVEQSPSGPTGARRTVSVTGSFLGTLRWSPVGSQHCTVSQHSRPVLRATQLHVLRASLSTVVCPGRVSAAPVPHGGPGCSLLQGRVCTSQSSPRLLSGLGDHPPGRCVCGARLFCRWFLVSCFALHG